MVLNDGDLGDLDIPQREDMEQPVSLERILWYLFFHESLRSFWSERKAILGNDRTTAFTDSYVGIGSVPFVYARCIVDECPITAFFQL